MSLPFPDECVTARSKVDSLVRFAVALNNLGIRMLSNDCYMHGCETIKDSLSVLRSLVHYCESLKQSLTIPTEQSTEPFQILAITDEVVNEVIAIHQSAIQRLANPIPPSKVICKFDDVVWCSDVATCYLNRNHTIEGQQSNSDESVQTLFPICIEDIDFSFPERCVEGMDYTDDEQKKKSSVQDLMLTVERLSFESAIILHNLGVTHLCLSLVSTVPSSPPSSSSPSSTGSTTEGSIGISNRRKAANLFELSNAVSSKLYYVATVQHGEILECMLGNLNILADEFRKHSEEESMEARCVAQTIERIEQTRSEISRISLSFRSNLASSA
jgi:hypothetical protein